MKSALCNNPAKMTILKEMHQFAKIERLEAGLCPTCGHLIEEGEFKDPISIQEFHISGMCQKCQDFVFGKEE